MRKLLPRSAIIVLIYAHFWQFSVVKKLCLLGGAMLFARFLFASSYSTMVGHGRKYIYLMNGSICIFPSISSLSVWSLFISFFLHTCSPAKEHQPRRALRSIHRVAARREAMHFSWQISSRYVICDTLLRFSLIEPFSCSDCEVIPILFSCL